MPVRTAPANDSTHHPKKTPVSNAATSASQLIDSRIAELNDWRGHLLSELRRLVLSANPDICEEWKWNIPVWSCSGIICTGETYKKTVKLTFTKGASLADPSQLFNSSLGGSVRRAIDFFEQSQIDEAGLRALVQSAIELNKSTASKKGKPAG